MKRFALLASIVMVALSAAAFASTATAAPPQSTSVTVPVNTTYSDSLGGTGTFVGTYEIERFTKQNGGLARGRRFALCACNRMAGVLRRIGGSSVGVGGRSASS